MAMIEIVNQGADKQRIINNLSDIWMFTGMYIDAIKQDDEQIINYAKQLRSNL